MSKKKTLSPTASLAACLDFAARMLSSRASVQDVCKKSVLAPMVVDAHRYGQHVVKHLELDTTRNLRKLLGALQRGKDMLCPGSPVEELDIADVTWDFEGPVKDTLEMELQELQERAAIEFESICAVFSTSSLDSAGEHAVIWFPQVNNQWDDSSLVSTKCLYLLYVCPGRVKVVKSMGDLIRRMYEELPTLRESGAKFSVWAVLLGLRTKYHQDELQLQPLVRGLRGSQDSGSNQYGADDPTNRADRSATTLSEGQEEKLLQDELPLLSPHFSIYHPDEKRSPAASIFTFDSSPETAATHQMASMNHYLENAAPIEAGENNEGELEEELESETTSSDRDKKERNFLATPDKHNRFARQRPVVSASVGDFSAFSRNNKELCSEATAQPGVVWQSCDRKIIRTSERSTLEVNITEQTECGCTEDGVQTEGKQSGNYDESQSSKPHSHNERVHPFESVEGLQGWMLEEVATPIGNSFNRSIFEFGFIQDNSEPEVSKPNAQPFPSNSPTYLCSKVKSYTIESPDHRTSDCVDNELQQNENASPGRLTDIEPSDAATSRPDMLSLPTKRTPVNYKDKLGARVWWELEYTARRLEQEEMEERQQRYWSRGRDRVKPATAFVGKRRMDPTGWSKNTSNRTAERKRVPIVEIEPTNQPAQLPQEHIKTESTSKCRHLIAQPNRYRSGDGEKKTAPFPKTASPAVKMSPFKPQLTRSSVESNQSNDTSNIEASTKSVNSSVACASLSDQDRYYEPNGFAVEFQEASISTSVSKVKERKNQRLFADCVSEQVKLLTCSISSSMTYCVDPERQQRLIATEHNGSNNQEEGGGDDSSLTSLRSMCSIYERGHDQNVSRLDVDEEPQSDEITAIPFTIQGRVPIRTRHPTSSTQASGTPEFHAAGCENDSSSCGIGSGWSLEYSPFFYTKSTADENKKSQLPVRVSVVNPPLTTLHEAQVSCASPSLATFIPIDDSNRTESAPTERTRESRLNELRQKNLQKLQHTRDISLQQQREKQRKRQVPSIPSSVYPKKASNRQLMQNALEFTLLAGGSMERERTAALKALAVSNCDNFVVLLKSAKELKFRALYENHVDLGTVIRIFSVMPSTSSSAPLKLGSCDTISQFFKYSSAKKQFLPVATRSFTVKTDACALVDQLAFKKKAKSSSAAIANLL